MRPLDEAVHQRRRRRARARREGPRSLAQDLSLAGSLGWLVVAPTLAGLAVGAWLDRRFGTGITFTAALLVVGVVAGCALAWQRVRRA